MAKHDKFCREFLTILQDGEEHKSDEIVEKCLEKGIDLRNNKRLIYNMASQLRLKGILEEGRRGVYRLKKGQNEGSIDMEVDNYIKKIKKELKKYKNFSWVNCSEKEWKTASVRGKQMIGLANEIIEIFS